ncbi:hypothetical protein AYI68_g3117 [Smittium mucronatum]|uniref:Uncharacterized protein n=1 Tax=Smittium mucronatum TaxID=133383 RepID=A0A1R0H0T9_9FUNG|nr:hypothetical protein AYI68_g3117 [Smittium mucronatum]
MVFLVSKDATPSVNIRCFSLQIFPLEICGCRVSGGGAALYGKRGSSVFSADLISLYVMQGRLEGIQLSKLGL